MAAKKRPYNINSLTMTTDVLRVRRAATIICARGSRRQQHPSVLRRASCHGPTLGPKSLESTPDSSDDNRVAAVFGEHDEVEFTSGWELLMQQRMVKNWLRSTADDTVLMRYPGEFVFPGGGIDGQESPEDAARREVSEELGIAVPVNARLRLLSVKQTRPINNVSNIMFNYVALAEENPWLQTFDPLAANRQLEQQREILANPGDFWGLDEPARRAASPEVWQHQWLDIAAAVRHGFTSMNRDFTPVNAFQASEFARYSRVARDPLFLTMLIALEMESFPSTASIVRHGDSLDVVAALEETQWLYDGTYSNNTAAARDP